jgi:Mg2+ and Co2+ transporter CorA
MQKKLQKASFNFIGSSRGDAVKMVSRIIQTLENLYELHEHLYDLAVKKTEVLKNNEDVSKLQELLKKEQLCIKMIQQKEEERMKQVAAWLGNQEDQSLTACIEKASGADKKKLEHLKDSFLEIMTKLKAANELNEQLTHYALQFINMTLDMVMPQEPALSYQHPKQPQEQRAPRRSMFDSKA